MHDTKQEFKVRCEEISKQLFRRQTAPRLLAHPTTLSASGRSVKQARCRLTKRFAKPGLELLPYRDNRIAHLDVEKKR